MTQGEAAHLRDLSQREEQRRLSKEELLRPRIVNRTEFIEGLGGEIVIRSLSQRQRQDLRSRSKFGTAEFNEDLLTDLSIIESIVDPKLTEADLEAIRDQDAAVYDEIVMRISLLNMMGRTDELKKDSNETPSSDSPSG